MRTLVATFVVAMTTTTALADGLAHNDDFIVLAPTQALADDVLTKAAALRSEIAIEWLGEELPPSVGTVSIHIEIGDGVEDRGLFWPIDTEGRTMHKLWITTGRKDTLDNTLAHELTHAVLATQFGTRAIDGISTSRLPPWCDEGIASLRDDAARIESRRKVLAWYARSGNWPSLKQAFAAKTISADDKAGYSVAASVTEYLLTQGSRQKFLQFAVAAGERGADAALAEHYGRDVADLQGQWQAWSGRGDAPLKAASAASALR